MVEAFIIKGPLSFLSQEKWEDILSPFALAAEKVDSDRHYFWAVRKEIIAHYYHKNLEELEMDNLGRVKKISWLIRHPGEKQNRNMPDLKVTGW